MSEEQKIMCKSEKKSVKNYKNDNDKRFIKDKNEQHKFKQTDVQQSESEISDLSVRLDKSDSASETREYDREDAINTKTKKQYKKRVKKSSVISQSESTVSLQSKQQQPPILEAKKKIVRNMHSTSPNRTETTSMNSSSYTPNPDKSKSNAKKDVKDKQNKK